MVYWRVARRTSRGLERKLRRATALVANKGFRRFLSMPSGDGFVIDRAPTPLSDPPKRA